MIVWTAQAKRSYEAVIDDILNKWTVKTALTFEQRINDLLVRLLKNQHLCPATRHKNLRKCVVHKNVSIVYKINRKNIEIITFIFNKDDHPFFE